MEFKVREENEVQIIDLVSDNVTLLSLAPNHGARLISLSFKHQNTIHPVLWEVTPDECKSGEWCKNEILFPFPNRIEDGRFVFKEKEYQFPINEVPLNNALHGLVRMKAFEVESQKIIDETAIMILKYDYDGSLDYYPFPFIFKVKYHYSKHQLTTTFTIENTGIDVLPFGLGWHPYFKLGDTLENVVLKIPEADHLLLGERNLPTGDEQKFSVTDLQLQDWELDDCFRLIDKKISYELSGKDITIAMVGAQEYNYLQLFTPKGKGSVAIEPMTSGVNVFNNKEGLRELKPKEVFEVFFDISVK